MVVPLLLCPAPAASRAPRYMSRFRHWSYYQRRHCWWSFHDVKDILKVSGGRWKIEECFRIMKTDFEARPVFLHDDIRIKAHFLICFLALVIYRYLERDLKNTFNCETILDKLNDEFRRYTRTRFYSTLHTRQANRCIAHSLRLWNGL